VNNLVLISASELTYSRELLLRKEPPETHVMIWTSVTLLAAVLIWIVFGKMDEVVKASGIVRPISNISLVRNVYPGEVADVFYKPGKRVVAGETLLKIKPDPLLAQERSVKAQIADAEERLSGLKAILDSYYSDRNRVPKTNLYAHTRFSSYYADKNLLVVKAKMARLLWEEETKIPLSGTTAVKIREFDYESQLSDINLEKWKTQFLA
jgi:multidrug efflux pump subunit AcrA (membrane-fusion protein)